ncbi:MAG: hypothetical protein LBQ54_07740 [Planctomycetaceae bacterium]|jgi:hypothetical protein|nr:hypothetical protein [Planctomycetaceae bacterium]
MPPAANARALDPGWDCRPEAITRSRCSLVSTGGTKRNVAGTKRKVVGNVIQPRPNGTQ